jgi:RNA polymerase sigma-70 factor (ECF subfamily)
MALFDNYAPMLRGVCRRYVSSDFDADDLLQEGFIKILKNISNYQETGSFKAWMKRIMINTALNFCKQQNSKRIAEWNDSYGNEIIEEDDNENSDNLESRILEANLKAEQILAIMEELPIGYKMVLNLYVIDGFSHKEIAEQLNISVNTSKSQLSRARKSMIEKTEQFLAKHKLSYEQQD